MNKRPTALYIAAAALVVAGLIGYAIYDSMQPGRYDQFATCLKDKGLTFFGAYWCPHCAAQKKIFGKSAKKLPYVECAIPGSNEMTQACADKKIQNFPTWAGPGETRTEGELSLQDLATRSGCPLTP